MGVTRRFEPRPINVEDELNDVIDRFNYADFDFSESDNEVVGVEQNADRYPLSPDSRSRKKKDRRVGRKYRRYIDVENGGLLTSKIGARKQRRIENARILMSYADKDDICTDFSDMVPHVVTPFEQLFLDQEYMQMWNEFMERDEEEQRQILESDKVDSGHGWFVVGGQAAKSPEQYLCEDARSHHPAYCGKACFERMDRKSRRLLSEKRLPWAFIQSLEEELLSFFSLTSSPQMNARDDSVYIGVFGSSLERALGHAIAQYLMLKSKSITLRGSGERLTEFRNPRSFFIPPHTRLITYLSSLRSDPIQLPPHSKLKGAKDAGGKEISPDPSFVNIPSGDSGS